MCKNWLLGELLLLEEHWEWEPSAVLGIYLFNFNFVVAQEVIKAVELLATIVTVVLPEDLEGKNFAVVIEETLQVFVGAATFQFYLIVVLVLSQIRRVLFHVDHFACVSKWIVWEGLWTANVTSFIGEISLSEFITINNAENS